MGRGPESASMPDVAAALLPGGEAVCSKWVQELAHTDKAIAERASRTLKKISEANGAALYPWRKALLEQAARSADVRVQWNLSLTLGRLPLRGQDKAVAVDLLFERLQHPGGLNRTCAMQALMDLSTSDAALRRRVKPIVKEFGENGTPAMRARARKLLPRLDP